MIREPVTLHCAFPGCTSIVTPDARHVDNLTAGGGWYCGHHDSPDEETAA